MPDVVFRYAVFPSAIVYDAIACRRLLTYNTLLRFAAIAITPFPHNTVTT